MQIDWLTVSAQILNFLILVWLLKRFLYQPVLSVMAQREEGIAARLEKASQREIEADEQGRIYRAKAEELEQAREERLADARDRAEREYSRLLEEARHEIDKQRQRWREELLREEEELRRTLKQELAASATQIAQQTLAELAGAELEEQMLAVFIRGVKALPEEERKRLVEDSGRLRLTSAFELDQQARKRLQVALGEAFATPIKLEITHDPRLICGIELAGSNQRVGWSVTEYLAQFEERIQELLGASRVGGKET
jgi:F-type H+-transporting ATPase subunit b